MDLEKLLKSIKLLEDEKSLLENKIKEERASAFSFLEKENIKQFKNDIATISYVKRQTIKYSDKESILEKIKDLPKYYDIIPEHKELNKVFENDIKNGDYKIDGVEVIKKELPMIRFK